MSGWTVGKKLFAGVGLLAAMLVLTSLGVGMLGYHACAGLPWIDAFVNTCMLLGGMGPVSAIDEDRLGPLGRATLRTLTALDRGPRPEHGPRSYLTVVNQVVAGWLLSLLAIALLFPALVAAVDAFARARRQHVEVLIWLR